MLSKIQKLEHLSQLIVVIWLLSATRTTNQPTNQQQQTAVMPKGRGKKQSYPFPILKRKMIMGCMKELGISLQENDLKSPQEEKCKVIYASILEKLMGINVLSGHIPLDRLDLFQFPQLHESSIISVRLFREMIKFMRTVGVTDFSICDLIAPESSRTVRNLSAIINFCRWREQKYQIYLSHKTELVDLGTKLEDITSENKRLALIFTDFHKRIEAEAPQAEAIEAEIDGLKTESAVLMESLERSQDDVHSLKKQYRALKAVDQEKKGLLNDRVECIHALERKIVKSPERIKKQLKALSGKIKRDKLEKVDLQQRLSDDQHKMDKLGELQTAIGQRIEEMQTIHTLKNHRHCKAEQDAKRLQTAKVAEEKKLKSIKRSHKNLEHQLKTKKALYEALKDEHKTKTLSVTAKNQQIATLQRERSRKNEQIRTSISNLDKRIEAEKEEMAQMDKHNGQCVLSLLAKYRQIVENVEMYHLNMRQGMESWTH